MSAGPDAFFNSNLFYDFQDLLIFTLNVFGPFAIFESSAYELKELLVISIIVINFEVTSLGCWILDPWAILGNFDFLAQSLKRPP